MPLPEPTSPPPLPAPTLNASLPACAGPLIVTGFGALSVCFGCSTVFCCSMTFFSGSGCCFGGGGGGGGGTVAMSVGSGGASRLMPAVSCRKYRTTPPMTRRMPAGTDRLFRRDDQPSYSSSNWDVDMAFTPAVYRSQDRREEDRCDG